MKVLVTHELFKPVSAGGGEEIVYNVVKKLEEKGVDLEVLTTGNPSVKSYQGIKTHRIPINRYLMNLAVPNIVKKAKDFDLIYTNNYNACLPSYIAGRILGKPVVCLVLGMYGSRWTKMRGRIFGTLSDWMERTQILHDYDKVVFMSDYARRQALNHGLKKDITEVIPPGMGTDYEKFKVGEKEPYVFFAGRFAKQKGLEYLIETAKRLPEVEFKLAGKGEEGENLKSVAPDNVEFLGWLDYDDLVEYYSKALIFCLPSIGEGFGLVLAEAMASGCAIVSTIPLEFEGFKVKKENPDQLVKAIRYLLENPDQARDMGRKNREKSKKYTWDNFTDRLLKIFKNLTEGSDGSG